MRKRIADAEKTFPNRTEGSVKKHWYKVGSIGRVSCQEAECVQDMHYADFAEDDVSNPGCCILKHY